MPWIASALFRTWPDLSCEPMLFPAKPDSFTRGDPDGLATKDQATLAGALVRCLAMKPAFRMTGSGRKCPPLCGFIGPFK